PLTVGQSTTLTSGSSTFTFTAATTAGVVNPNATVSSGGGPYTGATTLTSSKTLSIVHGGATSTVATGAGTTNTVQDLVDAINGVTPAAGLTVAGGALTGLKAKLLSTGQVEIIDTSGNGNLAVTGGDILTGAAATETHAAGSTVQDLVNAINADSTVGAKAVL